jgi:hypothetical protein
MVYVNTTANNGPDALTLATMQRPQSSLSRVVFPWDRQAKRFDTNEFNPIQTEGRLYPQDIDRVLNQLQLCPNYVPKGPWWCLAIIMPICAIMSILIFVSGISSSKGDDIAFIVVFYIVSLMSSILIPLFYYVCKNKKSLIEREKEFRAVMERENATNLQGRDIRWTVGRMGSWLTLELDYIVRQMN